MKINAFKPPMISKRIRSQGIENFEVVGPLLPYYSMANGKHKRIMLLKFKNGRRFMPISNPLGQIFFDGGRGYFDQCRPLGLLVYVIINLR
jgi:hypothetical protein